MSKKLKLNDKAIKEHISDWSYVTKDKDGNKIIKQKGVRSYTPFDVEKTGRLKGMKLVEFRDKDGKKPRVYCTHPFEFNGKYITEMTEGELGKLYENKDEVPF